MPNVLIIDDDRDVREFLAKVLRQKLHCDVATAADGQDALGHLAEKNFDVVITDIIMPNRSGLEAILDLRASHPGTRIIAISGGGRIRSMEFLQAATRMGADLALRKPFKMTALLKAVQSLLPLDDRRDENP